MTSPIIQAKTNPEWTKWNNVQNEGATDGYNPHREGMAKTALELVAELNDRGFTAENTQAKREEFNTLVSAAGTVRPSEISGLCHKAGFAHLDDLKLAVSVFGL